MFANIELFFFDASIFVALEFGPSLGKEAQPWVVMTTL